MRFTLHLLRQGRLSTITRCFSVSTRKNAITSVRENYVYNNLVSVPPQTTATLAGRQWLPGSQGRNCQYPTYIASPRENFPALYQSNQPVGDLHDLSKEAREILDDELHLHGAILFRKLPLPTGNEFNQFINVMGYTVMGYEGGTAVRHKVAEHVLTASNDPPNYTIEPHNEMSYADKYPMKVFFYCDVPAQPGQGGESAITDVREILPKLNPDLVLKLRKVGIRYCRYLPTRQPGGYTSWQEAFFTEDKQQVEQYFEKRERGYRWEKDGSLTYWYHLPAFATHPKTGEEVWFNQLHSHHASYFKDHPTWADLDIPDDKYPFHCYYGDGSEIEEETLQHIRNVLWNVTVGFQMQKGDVIVLDNIYVQHARLGFIGQRKLLVSLAMD